MGSRQETAQESHIKRQTLDDPELSAALQIFSKLLSTTAGPHGRIQFVQNSVGGPITMTSSSNRLLSAMSFSRPCLRLIVSAVQGHLRNHHNGGFLTGSLCLHLVLKAVEVENVRRKCVREMYEVLLDITDVYLNSSDSPISVNVDTSNVKVMLAFVRSILAVKPVCMLRLDSVNHMEQLVLRVFLNTVPDTPKSFLSDRLLILQFDKTDTISSEMLNGLLLEWPEKSVLLGAEELQVIQGATGSVKLALVTVSMSGDVDELLTNQTEAQQGVVQSAADHVIARMLEFCNWLHDNQVGLLLCQKVIHPRVKSYLRKKGILFIERLGLQPVVYIQDLSGASPISSVLVAPSNSACGELTSITHSVIHNKSYLRLQRAGSCVCTLLLCGALDQQVTELKSVVQSAVTGLYSLLQNPVALCGGGCWQVHLACYIRHMVKEKKDDLYSKLHMTRAQLQATTNAFTSSLEASAISLLSDSFSAWVDSRNWHMWHAPVGVDLTAETSPFVCACGLLTDSDIDKGSLLPLLEKGRNWGWQDEVARGGEEVLKGRLNVGDGVNLAWLVLDPLECVVSGVRTAAMTAATVLSIAQYIHDVN